MRLPASLVDCRFVNAIALMPAARMLFEPCTKLNKLCLGSCCLIDVKPQYAYSLPVLPSSLHHLELQSLPFQDGLLNCDWHCLDVCANLQHLSLRQVQT